MPARKSKRQRAAAQLSVDTALAARAAGTASPESSSEQGRAGPSGRAKNKTRPASGSAANGGTPGPSGTSGTPGTSKATAESDKPGPSGGSGLPRLLPAAGTPTSSGRTTPTSLPAAKEAAAADGDAKKNTLKRSLPLDANAKGAASGSRGSSSSPGSPGSSPLSSSSSSPAAADISTSTSTPTTQQQDQSQQQPPPTKRKRTHIEGRWTKDEDSKLRAAVNELNAKNWKKISQMAFGGLRSDVQCLHRWQKVLRPGLHKGPWSKDEDEIVLAFVTRSGGVGNVKWSVVAAQVKGRLGKQVRERWYNHLDPTLKKGPWEKCEDEQLLKLQVALGNRWCEIAKNIPGRSENAVKNRWNSAQRRAKAAKEAAAKREAKAEAELAAGGGAGGAAAALDKKAAAKRRKPRARRKQSGAASGANNSKKKSAAGKAKGARGRPGGTLAAKKRKAAGAAAGGGGRAKKRGRKAGTLPKATATSRKTQSKGSASDLSVMADIGTALQMCEMRSNTSPGPSPSTRPTTPPTLNVRAQQAVNITAANILAGAFERMAPKSQNRATPTPPPSSDVEDVAASALLGLFF